MLMYRRIILNAGIPFPRDPPVSPEAKDLICRLLQSEPRNRPSIQQIKEHPFFTSHIPWDLLESGKLPAPLIPAVQTDTDVRYFDPTFTQMTPALTPSDHPAMAMVTSGSSNEPIQMSSGSSSLIQSYYADFSYSAQ